MSTNMFRYVTTPILGFDAGTPGWSMQQNAGGVPNTRATGYLYMNDNTAITRFTDLTTYEKVLGNTTTIRQQKFTSTYNGTPGANKLGYTGKAPTSVRVTAIIGGKAPFTGADYAIAIIKNGQPISLQTPFASMGSMVSGQGFQIVLETDVDLITGDFLEVGIRNTINNPANNNSSNNNNLVVTDMQLRVSE